jgi:hypothetical protein
MTRALDPDTIAPPELRGYPYLLVLGPGPCADCAGTFRRRYVLVGEYAFRAYRCRTCFGAHAKAVRP